MQSSLELDCEDVKFDLKEYCLYLIPNISVSRIIVCKT